LGFGAFEESFNQYRGSYTELGSARAAHNTPLRVLAETGIVGGAAFMIFVLALSTRLVKAILHTRDNLSKTVQFSLAAGLAAYSFMSLTLDQLCEAHVWVIVGIALAAASFSNPDKALE